MVGGSPAGEDNGGPRSVDERHGGRYVPALDVGDDRHTQRSERVQHGLVPRQSGARPVRWANGAAGRRPDDGNDMNRQAVTRTAGLPAIRLEFACELAEVVNRRGFGPLDRKTKGDVA